MNFSGIMDTFLQRGSAITKTPRYLDGDTIHTALEQPALTQFRTNNFISNLYLNIYFKPVFKI